MAVYSGAAGIKQLREKLQQKSKMLIGESALKVATTLVDNSPVGAEFYTSKQGEIQNDAGDYKNSWSVGYGTPNPTVRAADTSGAGAVADAIVKSKQYNFQGAVYVTNSIPHAPMVEEGWADNPVYGWKAKDGYHVVRNNIGIAQAILELTALKVSQL